MPFVGEPLVDRATLRRAEPLPRGDGRAPEDYRWSSAAAHLTGRPDRAQALDWDYWERSGGVETWRQMHASAEFPDRVMLLRRCTYAGRPFGEQQFVEQLESRFQRVWRRWGFEKMAARA